MATIKPTTKYLRSTSSKTTSLTANRVVGLQNNNPIVSPTINPSADAIGGKSQPPAGFNGSGPDAITGKLPARATAESVTSSNTDRQAAVNEMLGLVDKASAIDAMLGGSGDQGNGKAQPLTDLLGSSRTEMPAFDKGFSPSPDGAALAATAAAGAGNPMNAFQSASVAGPLAELAGSQAKTPQDKSGLIASDDSNWFLDWVKGGTDPNGDGPRRNGHDQIKPEPNPDPGPTPAPVPSPPEPAPEPNPAPDPATPDPDNQGSSRINIYSQSMLNQIIASKAGKPASQGGSSDATPVDDGGLGGVVRVGSFAVNQSSIDGRNLFGQPVGPGVENVSGGNKGIDGFGRSNGAGAIDPGNEAGIPGGDPRFLQDPANAMPGNKPAPTLQSPVGNQENQNSSVSATLTAGARNLTLTGTALINGSGNALDNLINGNGATNELRGEAGNDSLDGKAGNDLLDGGTGRDQLTGGSGADRFRFATAGGFGTAQADRITDFSRGEGDRIELSRSAFGLAAGATLSFQTVNNDAELTRALGSSTLLVQDLRDGSMLFNQNGTAAGAGQGGVFAVVNQGLTLQASDFSLLA